jgi:hypothetical protein
MSVLCPRAKSSQIQQNPADAEQRKSKEKGWISLNPLVRIEPFQRVALTPKGKNLFLPLAGPATVRGVRSAFVPSGQDTMISGFRKANSSAIHQRSVSANDSAPRV